MPRPKSGKVHFQARVTPEQASAINAYLAGSALPSSPAQATHQKQAVVAEPKQIATPAPKANPVIIRTVDDAVSLLSMRSDRAPLLRPSGKI